MNEVKERKPYTYKKSKNNIDLNDEWIFINT